MRKIVLFFFVLLLSLCTQSDSAFALKHVPAADLYGDSGKDSSTENPEDTDMATTITAKGIYTDGDVTLDVTKTTDGTYYLYDSNRKVGVKIGTKLPALDELVDQGKFYDYFPENDLYSDTESYIMAITEGNNDDGSKIDISRYLELADMANTKDAFSAYRLKSITITQLTSDGKDLMPSASSPLAVLRVNLLHGENRWTMLFEEYRQNVTASPIELSGDELYDRWRVIPKEGAFLQVNAVCRMDVDDDYDDEDDDDDDDDLWGNTEVTTFCVPFVPNESGVTEIDAKGLKATITYEPSASPTVDVYWGLTRTYDFYKNVCGREGYDGKASPVYGLTYLPGGEVGVSDLDGHMPEYAFTLEQPGAYAKSDFTPNIILFGLGGRLMDLEHQDVQHHLLPMAEPSILCHEFTHLVTKSTAHLSSNLYEEGGALNESFSDIMSISMMKTADYGYGPETPWVIGGNGLIIGKSCLRNLADPNQSMDGESPQPDTYKGLYWNAQDKYNMMGVQNKFYYLLCDGAKGTNDNGTDYDVTGIGIEKGTQIAYLTLTKYCSPESDYSNIRDSWLSAAQELYGENSAEAQAVTKAWAAVGIDGEEPSGIHEIVNSKSSNGKSCWYTLDGRRLDGQPTKKGIYIYNGKMNILQ